MSDRRRRKAKEDESDEESQQSEVESGSEADGSNEELPSYDEAVKLEAEQNDSSANAKRETRKPRAEVRAPKLDPSVVPRSERFFLHDDREGERGGGMRSNRKPERKPEPDRPQRSRKGNDEDNAWKHDKFEELMASEPDHKSSNATSDSRRTGGNRGNQGNAVNSTQQHTNVEREASTGNNRGRDRDRDSARPSTAKTSERPITRGPPSTSNAAGAPANSAGSEGRNRNSRGPPSAPAGSAPSDPHNNQHDNRGPRNSEASSNRNNASGRSNDARNAQVNSKQGAPARGPPANNSNNSNTAPSTQRGGDRSRTEPRQQDSQRTSSRRVEVTQSAAPSGAQGSGSAPIVQTVRVTFPVKPPPGMKGPPGLDTVALNPSARAFQPTDDSPRAAGAGSASKERRSTKSTESYYEPGFDYSTAVHNASHVQALQQTTYYPAPAPATSTGPAGATTTTAAATPQKSTYTPATTAASPAVTAGPHTAVPVSAAPATQPVPYGSPQPVQYGGPHSAGHTPQSDYRGRRNNNIPGAPGVPGAEVDMYGHGHPQHAHNMGMYRGQNVPMQVQGGYMNMPVYDNSMYMNDHSHGHMQVQGMPSVPMYMPDGSVWYPTISQNMQHQQAGMQGMHGMVPGIPADGATGGTVYYPLPPQPPTTE